MPWFAKPKSKKEQVEEQRRRRRGEAETLSERWISLQTVAGTILFLLVGVVATLICFVGLSPVTQQLIANQRERVRVVAAFDFSYPSSVLTERAQNLASQQVGPSFRQPDHAVEEKMKLAVTALQTSLDQYQKDAAAENPDQQAAAREKLARGFALAQGFDLDPADVDSLTTNTTSAQRSEAFTDALMAVRGIINRGIYNPAQPGFQPAAKGVMYNFDIPGRMSASPVLSPDDALREFHLNLAPLELDTGAKMAVYNLVKQALKPNIQFDEKRTATAKQAARNAVQPVTVSVLEGQVLSDPNITVYDEAEQRELLNAYFAKLGEQSNLGAGSAHLLLQRFSYMLLILLSALAFSKSGLGRFEQSAKNIGLFVVLLLVNLVALRLVFSVGSTGVFQRHVEYLAILPWLAPTALAPLLTAVMLGAAPAAIMALVVSLLYTMMTGDTLEVFLLNLLASLVVVHLCRDARVRLRLVRAALFGGAAAALCAVFLGVLNQSTLAPPDVARQAFAALFTGLVTAVAAIGLLPVFENLFKATTDITLLELTDFNHPLLRKLQLVAPGTYHHSLMVANLSERAAAEVGANALLCRACSLYHDIGKTVKPEYFTENQRDGFNPHEDVNPSMSALIIKSHVSEGLDLAREYKLPRVIQDVISQHHGTTLIKYFYHKATRQQRLLTQTPFRRERAAKSSESAKAPAPERDEPVDQSFYRYDGPKPNFKESAIIALADCIEAASRSLRKVTPQAVEELIESLVNDRIEDHQLDDSPITILELKKIKSSFNLTLLNTLHSRVQYPANEEPAPSAADQAKGQPAGDATPAPAVKIPTAPAAGSATPRSAA